MEHIEKTGVHSGDSLSILPAQTLTEIAKTKMKQYAVKNCSKTWVIKDLMNIQYIVDGDQCLFYLKSIHVQAEQFQL